MTELRFPARFDVETRILGTLTVKETVRASIPPLAVLYTAYPGFSTAVVLPLVAALTAGGIWAKWKPRNRHLDTHFVNLAHTITKQAVNETRHPNRSKDYVRIEDGGAAAVIEVNPVNLDLKTGDQQAALHKIQQELISAVNYPIEIHSQQSKTDFTEYINHLKNQGIEDSNLGKSYLRKVENAADSEISHTRHFLVIRATPSDTEAVTEALRSKLNPEHSDHREVNRATVNMLNTRCSEALNILNTGELTANRLKEKRLEEFFNQNRWIHDPDAGDYRRTVALRDFPANVDMAWPVDLLRSPGYINITQVIQPQNPAKTTSKLQRLSEKLNAEINSLRLDGHRGTNRLQGILEDTEWMLDILANREDQPVQYAAYVTVHSSEKKRCKHWFNQLQNRLDTEQFGYLDDTFTEHKSRNSESPFKPDSWGHEQLVPASSAAAGFPYATQTVQQSSGVLYGQDTADDTLILLDRFNWRSHSTAWMGATGSGKSYATKIELIRSYLAYNNLQIIIVDPKKEYSSISRKLGGSKTTVKNGKQYSFGNQVRRFEPEDKGEDNTAAIVDVIKQIYSHATSNTEKTLVVIDEAHELLDAEDESGRLLLSKFIREARSSNTAVNLVTQNASDFTDHRRGRKILDNIPGKVFMRHERVPDSVVDYFDLSTREKQELYRLKTGNEYSYSEALFRVSDRLNSKVEIESTGAEDAVIKSGENG